MESIIKRELTPKEIVHHINGDPTDDSPENLILCKDIFEHCAIAHYEYTKENMIKVLQDVARELGKPPSREYMDALPGVPNGKTYYNRFGSYKNALREAGLCD